LSERRQKVPNKYKMEKKFTIQKPQRKIIVRIILNDQNSLNKHRITQYTKKGVKLKENRNED